MFEQEAMKAAEAYAAANPVSSAAEPSADTKEDTPVQEIDEDAMDVDGATQDKRKRKAESPVVRRVDPEPTKKKAKAGKWAVCWHEARS